MIISNKIYSQVSQEKFIPVITDYKEDGYPWIPTFLSSRIFVDLSDEEHFEREYERLLRNIFERPSEKRPPIGQPPGYLLTDEPIYLKTAHKVKSIKNALIQNKPNFQIFIDDYYETFLSALDDHIIEADISENSKTLDEMYIKEIERMSPLKDDFIDFFATLCKCSVEIDKEKVHSFFEKLLSYRVNYAESEVIKIKNRLTGCHIQFFAHELFLYTGAIAIKYERYELLSNLLKLPYFISKKYKENLVVGRFIAFNTGNFLFDYRNKRMSLNRINLEADTIKKRATNDQISFSDLQEVDLLFYYISCLQFPSLGEDYKKEWYPYWLPNLLVYDAYTFPRLKKLVSKRFFDKFKILLGVSSREDLESRLEQLGDERPGNISLFHYNIPSIRLGLKVDDIGKFE